MADVPFPTQAGQRTVVNQRGTSMDLDPSLPPPWWTEHDYELDEIVAVGHRVYRARRANNAKLNSLITDDANRDNWVDITGIGLDIRDLPDVVGGNKDKDTATIKPNHRIYADTRLGPVTINLPTQPDWANGDIIEIVDDYRCFNKTNPCKIVANGIRINAADPYPNGEPGDLTLDIVGLQDYWRFTYFIDKENPTSQWLYVLSAPTAGSGGGSAPVRVVPELVNTPNTKDSPTFVHPNKIYIVDTTLGEIYLQPEDDEFKDGDMLTIMDYKRTFGQEDEQGNSKAAMLLPTDVITFQNASPDDGIFYMDVVGPTSGWPFIFYKNLFMCINAPLDRAWMDSISNAINTLGGNDEDKKDHPTKAVVLEDAPMSLDASLVASTDPAPAVMMQVAQAPGMFTTEAVDSDVELAEPWKQYDCTLGRKKSFSVYLPPVYSVPARSRIRVRMMSAGTGVINVSPNDGDQILGLFNMENSTPRGKPRALHGQYNMIELESDGKAEWMVV